MEHGTSSAYSYHKCRCDICVAWKKAASAAYYQRNKERRKAQAMQYHEENREQALIRQKAWREGNAEVIRETRRKYYQANAEQVKQRVKDWREVNPEQARTLARKWKNDNREKVRASGRAYQAKRQAENPEAIRFNRREWAKTPKGRLANRLARHARRGAPTDQEYATILLRDPCAYCGEHGGEIDHIRPLNAGGTGMWDNLTSACRQHNARKNDLSLLQFLAKETHGNNLQSVT